MKLSSTLALGILVATACEPATDGTERAAQPAPAPEPEPPPKDELERVLREKAKKYAHPYVTAEEPIRGALEEGSTRDHLVILKNGHCYRFIGVGAPELDDLDLLLYDPSGVHVQEDLPRQQDQGQDRFPVLGLEQELCLGDSGAFRLRARARKGAGDYILGIYRSQS